MVFSLVSCSGVPRRPCTHGGQSPRNSIAQGQFRGIKRCFQTRDASGEYLNHGKYFEWYNNDKISLQGEYKMGKKTGRWIEYSESGKMISDRHFEEGQEISKP